MIPAMKVYFHLDASNPIVGLWCEDCEQPSVIQCDVVQMGPDGVGVIGTCSSCVNCGGSEGEDGDG